MTSCPKPCVCVCVHPMCMVVLYCSEAQLSYVFLEEKKKRQKLIDNTCGKFAPDTDIQQMSQPLPI
jgi:hypothetical protein